MLDVLVFKYYFAQNCLVFSSLPLPLYHETYLVMWLRFGNLFISGLMPVSALILKLEKECRDVSKSIRCVLYFVNNKLVVSPPSLDVDACTY